MAESPTMEVRARVSADTAQFTQGMDRAVKSANTFQQASSRLQGSITAIGVASGAAIAGLIAFGVKSFRAAAEVERLDLALEAVGASSGKGYEALKETSDSMRRLGIRAAVAQQTTIKFAQSNIDLSKATELVRKAQDLSVASNMSAEQALQSVTFAVTTGNTRVLRQIGITTGASDAYERYARSIGKASKDLTMAERRQAVVNLVLKEGSKALGAYELALESPAKLITLFGDLHDELKISMGDAFLKGFGPIIKSAFKLERAFVTAISSGGKLEVIVKAITALFKKLTAPIASAIDKFANFIEGLDLTGTKVGDLAGRLEMILPVIAGFGAAFATMAGQTIFKGVPIFGNLLQKLHPLPVAFLAMALTSSQVQKAFGELLSALQPLLGGAKGVATTFGGVASTAVSIFAAAISGLATVVRKSISFFSENKTALLLLKIALGMVIATLVAYKVAVMTQTGMDKISSAITKIKAVLFNVQAIAAARAAVAQAQYNHQTNLSNIASAKQVQATATLAVAQARQQAVTAAQTVALVRQGKVVGTSLPAALARASAAQKTLATAQSQATVATNAVATAQAKATISANTLAAAQGKLATASKAAMAPFLLKIAILVGLGIAFMHAWKNSETFREVVVNVFNTVAQVIGTVLSFVLTALGNLMIAFGTAISPTTSFGQTLIQVFQFIYTTALNVFIGIFKVFKFFLQVLKYASSGQTAFGKVVRAVLNFIFKAFAVVVGGILKFIGFFLEGLGMLLDTHGLVGNIIAGVLDFVFKAFATVIGGIIKFIGVFIEFLGNLLDTNNLVGMLIAKVLDFLIDAFATVFGGIFKFIGMFISFLGDLLDTNSIVGENIAKIIDKLLGAYFTLVQKVATFFAKIVDALYDWLVSNKQALETVLGFFNKFAEGVGKALSAIPNFFAGILIKIGEFVKAAASKISGFFKDAAEAAKKSVLTMVLAKPLADIAESFEKIGKSAEESFEKLAKPIKASATKIVDAYASVIDKDTFDKALKKVGDLRDNIEKLATTATKAKEQKFGTELVNSISAGIKSVGAFSEKIGNTILEVTKVPIAEALVQSISDALTGIGGFVKKAGEVVLEASDIKLGTALVQMLSDASKMIGGAVSKVGDFVYELKRFEVGDILGDFIGDVADLAIPIIDKLVNVMEGLKDVEVGKFLVENLSSLSLKAGETILGFASAVKSFTTGNVFDKTKEAFGDFADALKKGLGFGDVLEEERKRAEELAGINGEDDETLDELQKSADLMKKIRDAMTAGIESMRDVLTDLQDAAKQFADSLKDTIMSFAGLKGVELPDGFIPKAKSLIENMRMRLDKSQTFANQILTLQGLGLDAQAIQDLVESGPIKGAQLAASILGGGVDAIAQINDLQKQISFAGAAIGGFGSEAAFGEQIRNAQASLARVTDFEPRIGGLGNRQVVIEQGAFVVNVDTRGLETVEEKADLITQRIQETFAILAKELANK